MTVTDNPPTRDSANEAVDVEVELAIDDDARAKFDSLVRRLSRQSVEKHFAAYEDIAWDDPEYAIDRKDPRWEQVVHESLRQSEWFQALPPETRADLGICTAASMMKTGLQFESVLKRGLLEFAFKLPNNDPMFRYAYHETIEEAQHAMMFQEFVNRSGYDAPGLPWRIELATHRIVLMGRRFPALFFMFVLGGEDPIDYAQREGLKTEGGLPPLLDRIIRIHVTEEARHLSFARHYLKLESGKMGPVRRLVLGIGTPLILGTMAQLMLRPSRHLVRRFEIPGEVVRAAFVDNPEHASRTRDSLRKVRRLSREIGIINPVTKLIWRGLGIWADD